MIFIWGGTLRLSDLRDVFANVTIEENGIIINILKLISTFKKYINDESN